MLLEQFSVRFLGHLLQHGAQNLEAGAAVSELQARFVRQREFGKQLPEFLWGMKDLVVRNPVIGKGIDMVGDPRSVRQNLAESDLSADFCWIVGEIVTDRGIQPEKPCLGHLQRQDRGKGFSDRPHLKFRVRAGGNVKLPAGQSITFMNKDFAIMGDELALIRVLKEERSELTLVPS